MCTEQNGVLNMLNFVLSGGYTKSNLDTDTPFESTIHLQYFKKCIEIQMIQLCATT